MLSGLISDKDYGKIKTNFVFTGNSTSGSSTSPPDKIWRANSSEVRFLRVSFFFAGELFD